MPASGQSRRPRRLLKGCFAAGCAGPFLSLIILFVVFTLNNRPSDIRIPAPIIPANNGYDDFIRAASIMKSIKHQAPASMQTQPPTRNAYLAQTEACTSESAAGVAILQSAFKKPYMSPPQRSINLSMTKGALFRQMARTLTGVEEYYELTGQPAKAVDAALDCAEMGVTIPHGGSISDDLVDGAVESMGFDRIEIHLKLLNDKELAHAAERLERIAAKRVPFTDIVREEGYSTAAFHREAFTDPQMSSLRAYYNSIYGYLRPEDGSKPNVKEAWSTVKVALMNKRAAIQGSLRFYNDLSEEAKKPFAKKSQVKAPGGPLGELCDPDMIHTVRSIHLSRESVVNLLRIEVALLRYRQVEGRFPTKLNDVSPRFLRSIPNDPLTGAANRPYQYSLTNTTPGFLLYGVGPDMVDHGGKPGKTPRQEGYDIVAGHISRNRKLVP